LGPFFPKKKSPFYLLHLPFFFFFSGGQVEKIAPFLYTNPIPKAVSRLLTNPFPTFGIFLTLEHDTTTKVLLSKSLFSLSLSPGL
jgi:hypothetical protein